MTLNPTDPKRLLPLRISDDLTSEECDAVDQLVRYDQDASADLAAFARMRDMLTECGGQPAPTADRPSLWDRVERRLNAAAPRRRYWPRVATWQMAAACVVLVGLAVVAYAPSRNGADRPNARGPRIGIEPIGMAMAPARRNVVLRPLLGVLVQPITPELAWRFRLVSRDGAMIVDVLEKSPADRAGLRVGDVIVALDGLAIRGVDDLLAALANRVDGERVPCEVIRDGVTTRVDIELGVGADDEPAIPRFENTLAPCVRWGGDYLASNG